MKSGYMAMVQLVIDTINDTISNVEYTNKKIKIGTITQPSNINDYLNNLHKVYNWVWEDIQNCRASDIVASQKAKDFMSMHVRKGTY